MQRITKKRWFGPKIIGWGPAPKSWEGWVITLVWLVSLVSTLFYLHSIQSLNIINIAIVIVIKVEERDVSGAEVRSVVIIGDLQPNVKVCVVIHHVKVSGVGRP